MQYRTIFLPVHSNKEDLSYLFNCNRLSAEVWNLCVKLDKEYKEKTGHHINMSELQKQTKKCVLIHAQGIHHVVHKYLIALNAMYRSVKAKHENSNKVNLPYKNKKYFTSGWTYQTIRVDYKKGIIYLTKAQEKVNEKYVRQKQVRCFVKPESIPQNIVEIELIYKDKLYLAVKYKKEVEYLQIQSTNKASIDLGEIHSITSIDNNENAVIITGRKLREIKQLRNKHQATIYKRMSKCKKGSRQYKKYMKALNKLRVSSERRILDAVHKITKHYVDFCLTNNIKIVYYGDLDSCTRDTREDRVANTLVRQKLSQWNYGQIMLQLHNKLSRYGIELIKIKEYYTSSKCPICKQINKPKKRNYTCECGYRQHRDIVGAINILNDNSEYNIVRYGNKKYLQIA